MKFVFLPLCVLTWLGGALLFFFLNPIFGVLAFIGAGILTEGLLSAYRSEQAAAENRRASPE